MGDAKALGRSLLWAGVVAMILDPASGAAARPYPRFAVPRLAGITQPGLPPVTGRIHVDQFGYLPEAAKVAVISDPQKGYNAMDAYEPGSRLELRRRSDGAVVFSGAPKPWRGGAVHEDSGDRGWWFDFSAVGEPDSYYVFDPSTGLRSPAFRIAGDVYHPVLRAAMRTFYYQREAMPLEPPYAEEPWIFEAELLQDREARAVWAKDDPSTGQDLSGGWMDAGDTNKYPTFNSGVIHPLLYAWRENPEAFGDDFGIPESGNGLPDLLDELKYQLNWLVKMQDQDGGVFIKMGFVTYAGGQWPLHEDQRPRYYGPTCSASSLWTAGTLAHAARVYRKFESWRTFAEDLRQRALRAWQWYRKHPRSYDCDSGEIKSGSANRSAEGHDQMEALAAIHLWALTGDDAFHDVIRERAGRTRQLAEGLWSVYGAGAAEALLEYAGMPKADPGLRARIRGQLARSAASDQWAPPPEEDLYRAWMNPGAYHWGSSTPRAYYGAVALQAARHGDRGEADQARLRQRALDMLHSFHGVNPLSLVFLTNMARHGAELSASRIWHARFNFNTPHADNPPPGYLVGGPNQNYTGKSKEGKEGAVEWIKDQPRAKAYADFNEPWPMNSWEITENAIYYQAAYIRLLSSFARP